MWLWTLLACADIDTLIHNPRHCSVIGPDTCEGASDPVWGQLCTPCGEPYPWDRDYAWFDSTLAEGQSVRPLDAAALTQLAIPTDDGLATLDAWYIPSHGEVPALAELTLLYNHGNFAGIEHYMPRVRYLHELGYGVFVWDYRGYGQSQPAGAPSGPEFLADARQIWAEAQALAPGPVAPYGYSLGGIPAVEMALQDGPCALVLEASLTSMQMNASNNGGVSFPGSFLSSGGFENDQKLTGYPGPLLVMAAEHDTLFPVEDERRLYEAAPTDAKQLEVFDAWHGVGGDGGIPEHGLDAYGDALLGFFTEHAPGCLGP